MALSSLVSRITPNILLFLSLINFNSATAKNNEQTLIMMGSAIETCTTLSPQFCKLDAPLRDEKSALYALSTDSIGQIKKDWPTANKSHLTATITNLNTLLKTHQTLLSKRELLWAWRDIASQQMSELTQLEFDYVIDMLQVAQPDGQGRVLNIDLKNSKADQLWLDDSYKFIAASLKVKAENPKLLVVSATSRDPYFTASYYETVLSQMGVAVEWLALTPALATALTQGQCGQLEQFRHKYMGLYNTEAVFPKRVNTERRLCEQGVESLIEKINNSTGIVLAGNNSNTHNLSASFYNPDGKAYPWTSAVRDVPVLIAENKNAEFVAVQHIENKPQRAADVLINKKVKTKPGLESVEYAFLKSQFSETNSLALLATSLETTNQHVGLGIDANTSLVVIKSNEGNVLTVLGERGVIGLTLEQAQSYRYSYWPSGSVFNYNKQRFSLNQRSTENALPNIKIPSLPMQRFNNILTDNKLRSLTQALCLSQDTTAVGQQGAFLVSLNATDETSYKRINASRYGCAIEQLALKFSEIN